MRPEPLQFGRRELVNASPLRAMLVQAVPQKDRLADRTSDPGSSTTNELGTEEQPIKAADKAADVRRIAQM